MGELSGQVSIYLLAIVLCADAQLYVPYGQYGYTPYTQYPSPYPAYPYQQYQPYVSNQPIPYNYGYQVQPVSYPVYNYPAQSYPQPVYNPYPYAVNRQNATSQPSSYQPVYNPYPYTVNGQNVSSQPPSYQPVYNPYPYTVNGQNVSSQPQNVQDPYANVRVDIIDVEPKDFHYYKRLFNLEDNAYPVNVIEDTSGGSSSQTQSQPYYIVKSESKSFNYTNVPEPISIHDVKHKTFSFKRTFTVDPSNPKSSVINLNFVNGVQVTDTPTSDIYDEETTQRVSATEATPNFDNTEETVDVVGTTESEDPSDVSSWFK